MKVGELFSHIFGSLRSDREPLLNEDELSLASLVYDVAWKEIEECDSDDEGGYYDADCETDSVLSFAVKVETAVDNFETVVKQFEKTYKAKNTFLKNFNHWSAFRKNNVKQLKEIAEAIQTDKFNGDIATVVGGVVGAAGGVVVGLSFLTPLAFITVPLAIGGGVAAGLGGGVIVGTTGTNIVLLKKKLEEAKTLVMQEEASFSSMTHWFTHTEELKKALESLIDYRLLNEMTEDVKKFLGEMRDSRNLLEGEYKRRFEQLTKLCMAKMSKLSSIRMDFGNEFAPVVMTFVFVVCLMRTRSRVVLDCALLTQRLVVGLMSTVDIGAEAGQLIVGLVARGAASAGRQAVARIAVMGTFVALGIIIDVLNVVLSSIDIHTRAESKHAKKVKEAADQLEEEYLFMESVYNELSKYKIETQSHVKRTTVVVSHVPTDAKPKDIQEAVGHYLPKEARLYIKLEKLPTGGNNWFVKVPTKYSQEFLCQSHISIKGEPCLVMK